MWKALTLFLIGLSADICIGSSGSPDVTIHYNFLGPHARRSEISLQNNRLFKISIEGEGQAPVCQSRDLTDADILALLKRDGLFKMRPTADDSDYACEGSRTLSMQVDSRSVRLREACKPRKDRADSAVDLAMDSLSNYLSGLVERDNEKCPEGA